MWILLLQILLAFVPPICNSQQQTSIYHHATDMAHAQSYFNATSSFISRNADALAAEARHRQFTPAELDKLFRYRITLFQLLSLGGLNGYSSQICRMLRWRNSTRLSKCEWHHHHWKCQFLFTAGHGSKLFQRAAWAFAIRQFNHWYWSSSISVLPKIAWASKVPKRQWCETNILWTFTFILRMSRDLRQALNRRCSGLSRGQECSFNLALDHEESVHWGPGLVDIFFRLAKSVYYKFVDCWFMFRLKMCGQRFGPPWLWQWWRGQDSNRYQWWKPVSHVSHVSQVLHGRTPMQVVFEDLARPTNTGLMNWKSCVTYVYIYIGLFFQLRFLDISLKKRISSSDPECTDSISVSERGKTLMRMCGESSEDIVLLSEGNTLEVRPDLDFDPSFMNLGSFCVQVKLDTRTKSILPRRGILAEFWPLGCATQPQPQAGYLQLRNDTHAVYVCSIGHVFLPDLARSRTVECKRHQWNQKVGDCYSYDFLRYNIILFVIEWLLNPAFFFLNKPKKIWKC